jgi:hypothetical protein
LAGTPRQQRKLAENALLQGISRSTTACEMRKKGVRHPDSIGAVKGCRSEWKALILSTESLFPLPAEFRYLFIAGKASPL